jgi:hypothetical protein
MAPRKAPKPKSENDGKGTPAQIAALKKSKKPFVATAVVGSKGSKPNMNQGKKVAPGGGKNIPKIREVPQMSSSAFRGSGTPLGSSFAKPTKTQLVNAALSAVSLPGSGQVRNAVAKKLGTSRAYSAYDSTIGAASKGLNASGMGGKVSRTQTPFGPTLRSTVVGSPAQQSARMGGLAANADRIASSAARNEKNKAIISVIKGFGKASNAKTQAIGSYAAVKSKQKKKK